jgi:hypothetical protein
VVALWAIASLLAAPSVHALERHLTLSTDEPSEWNGDGSCALQYWNACTGWTWTWTGWSALDRIGVNYTSCPGGFLVGVDIFTRFTNGVDPEPGYGFTATLMAFAADGSGCPTGPVLASTTFLPNATTQPVNFPAPVAMPTSFVALVQMGSAGSGTARYGSDLDAQGPTGPQGCGTCFPTTRVSNSYYYGTVGAPLCPGSQLGTVCDVEWRWTARMTVPIGVGDSSWGQIKGLYR